MREVVLILEIARLNDVPKQSQTLLLYHSKKSAGVSRRNNVLIFPFT